MILFPESVRTESSVIDISGQITDLSRIIEVTVDSWPTAVNPDGSFRIRRGVRHGTSTLQIAALDEWGNQASKTVTVTRTAPVATATPSTVIPKPVTKPVADTAAPSIELPEVTTTTERTIELTGRVRDASRIVEVTVEGRPVAIGTDGVIRIKRGVSIGANTLKVAALDVWGNRAERQISVERQRPFADINFGAYHAIVIGNNDYAYVAKLKTAVNDAQAVAQALRENYGFTVDLLVNATRDDVIGALASARAKLKANDNLLVYYAGHGVLDTYAEEGFWLPVDAK